MKWTPAEIKLLGTGTDAAIAAKLGRSEDAVLSKRIKAGIAAKPKARQWTRAELARLGKVSDATLAAQLGCSRRHVMVTRERRGIFPFSAKNTPIKFR